MLIATDAMRLVLLMRCFATADALLLVPLIRCFRID